MCKLDAIIDAADLKQGQRVLEIGCGWGSFAIRASQRTGGSMRTSASRVLWV